MIDLFEDIFWETATQAAVLFMPIISIILIVKLIHYFIIRGSD